MRVWHACALITTPDEDPQVICHMGVITTPFSRIIRPLGSTPRFVNGLEGLLGCLLLDGQPAGVTQAILPAVPTFEHEVTAQAGSEPRIYGAEDFLSSVCASSTPGFFIHEDPSGTRGDRGCSRRRETPRARKARGHA
jgi:hypothetical protein